MNKDGLLAAIAADGFGRFTADQEAVRAAVPDPIERLRAMGRLYVMRAQEPPNIIRLMVGKGIGKEAPPPELSGWRWRGCSTSCATRCRNTWSRLGVWTRST